MTLDDLSEKIDKRFDNLDSKVDQLRETVAVHDSTLKIHDRENRKMDDRLSHLEKIVWTALGSGVAAGTAIGKFFM